MYIPKEFIIDLGPHQNSVVNKESILRNIESVKKEKFLEDYIRAIQIAVAKNPTLNVEDVQEILEFTNDRLNKLRGLDSIGEVFNEAKKNNNKFKNISIIDTPKELNDKTKEGVRKNVTYVKININGRNEIYEITNVEKVMKTINNKAILDKMSEQEIINFLKENSKQIDMTSVENDSTNELNSDAINKEIDRIYNPYLRESFKLHQNDILKERLEIDKKWPDSKIEYGMNSNGERIYLVEDKIIKFEGKERNMRILSDNNSQELKHATFDNFQNGKTYMEENPEPNSKNIDDYDGKETLLEGIVEAIYTNNSLTEEQIDLITNFLDTCVTYEEQSKSNLISGTLYDIYETYYNYSKDDKNFLNDEIRQIFERKEALNKTLEQPKLENEKVKKLELQNPNAFITTAAILESTLVLGLIVSLISLFK